MVSSGIRVGAWDYLKWSNIVPITRGAKLIAAKIIVYAGEDDQYFSLITPEAYRALESWMKYRSDCGEDITGNSWIMRDLWNVARPRQKGEIQQPNKLQSVGIKRLMERALWAQGLRTKLEPGKKRYEFQTDHGLRKVFRTRCELAGMKISNIEILMNHSIGLSDSYFRAGENEIINDYMKAIEFLELSNEDKLKRQVEELTEQTQDNRSLLKEKLAEKEDEIANLSRRDILNADAVAALSDQVMKLMKEVEALKTQI